MSTTTDDHQTVEHHDWTHFFEREKLDKDIGSVQAEILLDLSGGTTPPHVKRTLTQLFLQYNSIATVHLQQHNDNWRQMVFNNAAIEIKVIRECLGSVMQESHERREYIDLVFGCLRSERDDLLCAILNHLQEHLFNVVSMDTMEQFLKLLISVPYMTDEAIHSDDTDSRPHLILNTLKLYRPFHEQVFRLVREDFQQLQSDYKTAVSPNVARAIVVMALFAKEDSFVERVKLQWICSLLSRSDLPNYLREAICSFPISDLIDTQEELQQCFSLFETCCKSTPDPRVAIACTKAIDSLVPVAETVALDMLDTLLASLRDCIVYCTKLLTSYHSRKLEDLFSHLVMIVGSTLTENMTDDMDDWLLGVLNLILSADSSLHSYAFHLIGISIAFTFTKSMTAMVEPSFEYIMKTDLYRYVDLVEDGRRPSAEVFNAFIAIAIIQYGFSEIPEKRVYYLQRWDIRTLLNKVRYIPYLKNNSYTLLGSVVKYLGIDCLLTVEENAVDFMTRLCTDVYTEYFRNGCSIDTTINSMLWCLSIALSRTSPLFTCHELNTLGTCVPWKLFAKYLKASICDTVDDACFLTTAISTFLEIYPFERNAVVKYFHKISELFIICLVSFQDEDLYEIYRVISTLLPIIEDAIVAGYSIHPEVVKASLDRLLGFLEEDEYDIQPLLARYERLKCIL